MKAGVARLALLLALLATTCAWAGARETAVILADPADPYHALAREIAAKEGLPLVDSLDDALAREPVFLLWVVSPDRLSDEALVEFGQAMLRRESAVSTGIITGRTPEQARALWHRAAEARGERMVAANAANPAGHIEAGIVASDGDRQPLTKTGFLQSLARADYFTYTGHGSQSALYLQEGVAVRASDLPALGPVVVATGSCNTFRPWEQDSIALAFVDRGAAAYAGFAYSPNEGYLLGEFEGLPLRYTWPEFPIGHAVQAQNRGTLAGFAAFPYYFLLGDPRLALHSEAPYRLAEDRTAGSERILRYAGAPEGVIPVRLPGGARYSFVEIEGVTASWQDEPFYNDRLQMVDIGLDKFLLFEHPGGDFVLHLRTRPSWAWVAGDVLLDSLDNTLLYLQDHGGALIMIVAGGLALLLVLFLVLRGSKRVGFRSLALAALLGLVAAVLHVLYALARLDAVTITAKNVAFGALSPASTFLLVTSGAFFYLRARSWWGRAVGLAVATLPALAPAVLLFPILAVADELLIGGRLGTGLWNTHMAWQPLISVPMLGLALAAGLVLLRPAAGGEAAASNGVARQTGEAGAEDVSRGRAPVVMARILLGLNAVLWTVLGVVSLMRPAAAGWAGAPWVAVALMFGNAAAMAWLAWALGKPRALWYWAAVVVVAVNVLLSVTDEFGLLDLAVLLVDGVLLVLLLAARSRFLPVKAKQSDGEGMTYEKRRSF